MYYGELNFQDFMLPADHAAAAMKTINNYVDFRIRQACEAWRRRDAQLRELLTEKDRTIAARDETIARLEGRIEEYQHELGL